MTEPMDMNCARLGEVAAELALGVLTGRERAEAVAHLARCDDCREDVRHLMETGEGLLGLLPEREPPAGFETRVLDRLGLGGTGPRPAVAWPGGPRPATPSPDAPSSVDALSSDALSSDALSSDAPRRDAPPSRGAVRGPRRAGRRGPSGPPSRLGAASRPSLPRRTLAAAAVALAVIGAGLGGWGLGMGMSSHPSQQTAQAPLTSAAFLTASHQDVGQVFVYWGSPRWLYMSVDLSSGDGVVTCQLLRADGSVATVGSFQLADGYGSWGSPDPGDLGSVRGARLVAPGGKVLAVATFG